MTHIYLWYIHLKFRIRILSLCASVLIRFKMIYIYEGPRIYTPTLSRYLDMMCKLITINVYDWHPFDITYNFYVLCVTEMLFFVKCDIILW